MKFIVLLLLLSISACVHADKIYVDKQKMTLSYLDGKGHIVVSFPVCLGKNYGQKKQQGDLKTPEGSFYVVSIENSSKWDETHDDWNGPGSGPYGPKFIRLKTPKFRGIGIHGTNQPKSIGTRASEGCIRLNNNDLLKLVKLVKPGLKVEVSKDSYETYVAPKSKKYKNYSSRKKYSRHKSKRKSHKRR
ncbi:MAG: L,D-transpeptidase [Prevotella sp.]|nr:L,D-transpeptidase [Bacteroides sp.]MCM1365930.1 L,D-transpeptidase [Prevotella sp.]MCM1436649.1 L,D-transpeptidase [Prevotella sp.]